MADKEINDLTSGAAAASGDLGHIVRSGNSRKVTFGDAAGKNTGTASGTVAAGNDSRFTTAASDTVAGHIEIADVSEMEAGTDTTRAVTPGRQHRHPSAAKFWAYIKVASGVPTLFATFNVTSLVDQGTGEVILNFGTAFSSANWSCALSCTDAGSSAPAARRHPALFTQTASSIYCLSWDSTPGGNLLVDPLAWHVQGYGDQ